MTAMTSTKTTDQMIIRTDCIGRVRVSAEHREQLLDSYERSSLSGPKFAELHGVKYQTFATWVQKRRRQRDQYKTPKDAVPVNLLETLVELELPEKAETSELRDEMSGLTVKHSSGVSLTIQNESQAKLAATLFKNLNSNSAC